MTNNTSFIARRSCNVNFFMLMFDGSSKNVVYFEMKLLMHLHKASTQNKYEYA